MGYSLFSPRKAREKAPYQDDQSLGQQIGRVDIRCTLKADDSRWTESRDVQNAVQITGLLHFNVEFNAQVGVPLRSASVQIDVGTGVNEEPVPTIKECAPKSAIKGPPMKQHIVDTMTTDPQVELTTPYGGVKGGGRMHQVSKEFEGEHIWYFKAGSPSHKDDSRVTGTCFTWTRTLLGDHASSDRSFDGAIVLHRKNDTHSALRVKVEVQPWLWHHRVNFARSTPRNSHPIKPRAESFLGPEAFAQLRKGIQGQILEQNVKLAGIEVPNTQVAVLPPAQVNTAVAEPLAQVDAACAQQTTAQEVTTTKITKEFTENLLTGSATVVGEQLLAT